MFFVTDRPGFKFLFYYLLALCPWENYSSSWSLSFFLSKLGIITITSKLCKILNEFGYIWKYEMPCLLEGNSGFPLGAELPNFSVSLIQWNQRKDNFSSGLWAKSLIKIPEGFGNIRFFPRLHYPEVLVDLSGLDKSTHGPKSGAWQYPEGLYMFIDNIFLIHFFQVLDIIYFSFLYVSESLEWITLYIINLWNLIYTKLLLWHFQFTRPFLMCSLDSSWNTVRMEDHELVPFTDWWTWAREINRSGRWFRGRWEVRG